MPRALEVIPMHPPHVPVGAVLPYAGPIAEAGKPAQVEANLASVGFLFCAGQVAPPRGVPPGLTG